MGAPTVGVLGSRLSREVQRIREALRRGGARVLVADLGGFPAVRRVRVSLDRLEVGSVELGAAPVWLVRQLETLRRVDEGLSPAARRALGADIEEALVCDREVRAMVESLVYSLDEVARVVNPPEAAALHEQKPLLTALLRRAGLPVPESLTTTDRASAEAFVEALGGQAICKAAAGGGETRLATSALDELDPEATSLPGPLLFQRRILGRSLRGYVVGGELISCAEVLHGDVVDWRADQRGLRPVRADQALSQVFTGACEASGLDYAGLDVELDEAGAPWLLDVNPAPLFASYEQASGADIAGALARLLIQEARAT